ncbi:MAG TPA: RCC1 domain-containing protein, partial [Verrucomicrobiae bacterium]
FLRQDGTVFGYDYDGRTNDIPPGATNAVAIAVGLWHSLALRADGTVVSWGGLGGVATNVPVGLKNAIAIDAGAGFDVALIGNGSPMVRAPLSYPILDANGFSVSIPTQSGRVYRLEYKASWADANWAALPLVAGTGKEVTLTDPTVSGTQRFFRVRRW